MKPYVHTKTCTQMFKLHYLQQLKTGNHSNVYQLVNRQTKHGIRTIEYYPAIKRNKILIDATIRINFKNMKEARFKDYIWYDSTYIKYSKKANLQSKAQTSGCLGLGVRMRVSYEWARGSFLEVTEMS